MHMCVYLPRRASIENGGTVRHMELLIFLDNGAGGAGARARAALAPVPADIKIRHVPIPFACGYLSLLSTTLIRVV